MLHYSYSINNNLTGDLLTAANGLLVHNPYVYKGYYYDSDTGYYYLKSRYYDPRIHRFLSADKIDYLDPKSLSSLNLYVYCGDNPVMMMDENGSRSQKFWAQLASGLMILGGAIAMFVPGGQLLGMGLIGAGIGSLVGGEISESMGGSYLVGWGIGALIGAFGGQYLASATGILTSSFSLASGGLALSGAGSLGAGLMVVTGAQMIGAGALVGGLLALAFASNNRPGNNTVQNKMFQDAAKKAGVNPSNPRSRNILRDIHNYIRKNNLNLGFEELVELIRSWF
jgi:RHS repeat-associated protein